ncbi:hypothetical protein [Streptomyces erythrochromogenes]|uniref:hypothetical protein n=1 Tax=Streptomyces erythrochromogenes TaxID=285574 RepID=UPI0036C8BACA
MSVDRPSPSGIPPRWMPIGDDPEVCPAGQWWDVVRVSEDVGWRAIEILQAEGEPIGPVILCDEVTELRMCLLVPVGTAATWQEPDTVALGSRCHLVVPPLEATDPPGLHWYSLPASPRVLTRAAALSRAIGRARRQLRGPSRST